MTRAEAYAKIKEYGLQETIKSHYGLNYTNLSTSILVAEVEDYEFTANEEVETVNCCSKLDTLIEILHKKHLLCTSEYKTLMS